MADRRGWIGRSRAAPTGSACCSPVHARRCTRAGAYGEALRGQRRPGAAADRCASRAAGRWPARQIAVRRAVPACCRAAFLLRGPVWLDAARANRAGAGAAPASRRRFPRTALVWAPEDVATAHGRRPVMTGYSTGWLELSADLETAAPAPAGELAQRPAPGGAAPARGALRRAARVDRLAAGPATRPTDGRSAIMAPTGLPRAGSPGGRGQRRAAAPVGPRSRGARRRDHDRPPRGGRHLRGRLRGAARARAARHPPPALARDRPAHSPHGVRWLDLGGLATDRSPGIARFKLGLGGEIVTLAGTFLLWAQ